MAKVKLNGLESAVRNQEPLETVAKWDVELGYALHLAESVNRDTREYREQRETILNQLQPGNRGYLSVLKEDYVNSINSEDAE